MSASNETVATTDQELVITRTLAAPRDLVWKAWTEAERLAQWWGPKGCTIAVRKLEMRPGGVFHYSMQMGDAPTMWGKFVYQEVVAPERLVFVNSFADEHEAIIRHPMAPTWPLEVKNTLTFTEADGQTTLTLRGGPVNASEEERQTFAQMRPMVEKGFDGTFAQLAEYLAQVQG